MLNKLKFLSLIFASVLMVACGSTDQKEDSSSTNGADDQTTDTAMVSGAGDGSDMEGSDLTAEVATGVDSLEQALTVYYFEFDQYSLSSETKSNLDIVATALKNSTATVRLEGHADERGSREYNLALSEKRAETVKKYLTIQGVAASQIETIGYGEEKPAVVGNHNQNRRVELVK
ncbi:MAG: OmpA family protein [Pseudomonadales bacterium]|nr:OmpA family protein [Pseudomonadales bacterium]